MRFVGIPGRQRQAGQLPQLIHQRHNLGGQFPATDANGRGRAARRSASVGQAGIRFGSTRAMLMHFDEGSFHPP